MYKIYKFPFSLLLVLFIASENTLQAKESEDSGRQGYAKVSFGKVKGESQLIETSGNREIAGIYPHLTTYSQSREDGKFFKDGHQECGIGGIILWAENYG